MRLVDEIGVILLYQTEHRIVLLNVLVHIDGQIGLVHSQVELLSFCIFVQSL